MMSNTIEKMGMTKYGTWWRRVLLPLLLALLASGFVGAGTGLASPATPQRPVTVSHQYADAAPALEMYNGSLYVGWTGRNAAHNLNLMTYTPTTRNFGPAQVLTDTTLVGSGPSLANFYGNLYVAWMGTDHHLNVARYNPANPGVLASKVTLRETSYNAPVLGSFNGRMYLGWRGTDGHLNLISSVDGSTFGSKVTYNIPIRTSPSLVAANMYLYVCWEDTSAQSHVVAGYYDPLHPNSLDGVITLSATSQQPVGVSGAGVPAPWVNIAWRSANDAHIRLGVFEGDATVHHVVTTTQTTPYTPVLFDSAYMSWTGTDAAQSVNISQITNI